MKIEAELFQLTTTAKILSVSALITDLILVNYLLLTCLFFGLP